MRLSLISHRTTGAALALGLALSARPALAAERLQISPWIDGPIAAGAAGVWLGVTLATPEPGPLDGPTAGEPGGIDAWAPYRGNDAFLTVSDSILVGTIAAGSLLTLADGLRDENAVAHVVIYAEALLLNGMVTESAKQLVLRPRPYTYAEATGHADDRYSFFSGHTSWTAVASFGAARIFDLSGDLETWERVALYGGATAITAGVGASRVAAGMHFPTDVLVGALVGTSIGLGVPELHRPGGLLFGAGAVPGGGAQLSLAGSF